MRTKCVHRLLFAVVAEAGSKNKQMIVSDVFAASGPPFHPPALHPCLILCTLFHSVMKDHNDRIMASDQIILKRMFSFT